MSRPNANGLPKGLRKDLKGFFIDYYFKQGGLKRRKRVRLGNVSLEKAIRVLTKHEDAVAEGKFLGVGTPKVIHFLKPQIAFCSIQNPGKRPITRTAG